MNKFLSSAIGIINGFVALSVMVTAAVYGYLEAGITGMALGAVAGFFLAIMLCGALALWVDMRNSLRLVAQSIDRLKAQE